MSIEESSNQVGKEVANHSKSTKRKGDELKNIKPMGIGVNV